MNSGIFSGKVLVSLSVRIILGIAFSLILSMPLLSCRTVSMSVPGESEIVRQNLAAEYINIAEAHEKLKNYESAIKYYRMAEDINGNSTDLTYKIARCSALLQDWGNARKLYEGLLSQDSDNINLKLSIAYIDAMSGDFDSALAEYRLLAEENPTDSSILKNYILVLMADGKYELAEQHFISFKEKFPDEKSIPEMNDKLKAALQD